MSAAVYCVYRRRNAGVVRELLNPVVAAGWSTALWALDELDPSLVRWTLGSGPGAKFGLVNSLLGERPPARDERVVVADDDACFARGSLVSFVRVAERAGLDLAQPAHVPWSNISHRLTWMRPFSNARLTTFVEIGPIFAVSPAWRAAVVPFPEDRGMGWGLDVDWMLLRAEGCRLGIVDSTPVRHLAPFATDYAPQDEVERLGERLAELGATGWGDLRRTLATWRPWQAQPPWLAQPPSKRS